MRGGSARLAIRDATGEEGSHDDRLGQGDLQQVRRPKGFRSTFDTIRTGNNASDSGVRAQETACPATSPVLATYSTTHTVTHTPEPRSLSWGELHAGVLSAVLAAAAAAAICAYSAGVVEATTARSHQSEHEPDP